MSLKSFFALRDGLPLLKINLDSQEIISDNKKQFTLLSGFFQAITSFTDSVDKLGEIDEVQMTDQIFSFWRKKYKHSVILFIICSGENTGKPFRKAMLEESSATFLHMYQEELQEKWTGETNQFQAFEQVFRDIVKATSAILDMQSDELEEIPGNKIDSKMGVFNLTTRQFEPNHESIVTMAKLLAKTEGIFAETAGGVTLASAMKLIDSGHIDKEAVTVLSITGNGMKTKEAIIGHTGEPHHIDPNLKSFEEVLKTIENK